MKKILFLVLIIFSSSDSFAQEATAEEVAIVAAKEYCNCVNNIFTFIDLEIADIIIATADAPSKEAAAKILADMDERLHRRFFNLAEFISGPKIKGEFDTCLETVYKEMNVLLNQKDNKLTKDELVDLMVAELQKKISCKLGRAMLAKNRL